MKIKKPAWIDDSPHRAGKRLSNIYWGEYPVWKRDEEILKLADLDEELVIYNHTFIYFHRGVEIGRESFKTQGSQNVVYHIPTGYILKDSSFKPKKHGINHVDVIKESYNIKFICKHENLATNVEIIIKKPENAVMSVTDARNEIISNPNFPAGYDIDVPKFTEFPDELVVDNDYTYNVPLKIGTAVPKPIKKVTIKYYLVDDNGDQSIYKTETHRYLMGNFDYNISIPVGFEQTKRVDNDEYNTSIWIKAKVYNINIRLATYKNGNINRVWHTYVLKRKYNETVSQSDLQPLPDNLKIGVAPSLFKVTLRYPDGFVFNTITVTSDLNIDLEVKASLAMVEIISEAEVPKIEEAGIGVYTYGLPSGEVKPGSIKTVKMKFVANSIGLEPGEKAFAVVFPYNPVKQVISGNGYELVSGKNVGISIVKDTNFVHKLKTDFGTELNGNVNDIPKIETIYLGKPKSSTEYSNFNTYKMNNMHTGTYMYISDNFNKDEINPDRTLKERWNYRVFDREFDWTIMDNANITDYDKNSHKCWLIISNIVLHQVPVGTDIKLLEKSIACGLPFPDVVGHTDNIKDKYSNSIHGTLPNIQIYEPFIDKICPLTIKDYRYYLCDNARDFITDVEYKLKDIENFYGTSDIEGYNRNIIVNDIDVDNKYYKIDDYYVYIPYFSYHKDNFDEIDSRYKFESNEYYSILKDNVAFYINNHNQYYYLQMHRAHNWWKNIYREDLIDGSLLPVVKGQETNIICYNYWDMVNHAIAKSMDRNHTVNSKMLDAIEEISKSAVIKVNMQLLPVCIDVEDGKFPSMTVDMKEKDFKNKVFIDKNPIIVYSPVNVKRIFNNIPRLTYFRDPGSYKLDEYNPFNNEFPHIDKVYRDKHTNTDEMFKAFYDGVVKYRGYPDSMANNSIGSIKKLYAYRPEIYYRKGSSYNNYDELTKEVLFNKRSKNSSYNINLYKLWKKYRINPLIPVYIHASLKSEYFNDDTTGDMLYHGLDYTVYEVAKNKLFINIDAYQDWLSPSFNSSYNYYAAADNKYKELIEYTRGITIFDSWKEEISYDNPQ